MVFERQSRQTGVGALPRNALQSPTGGATAGAATATASTSLSPTRGQQNRSTTTPQSQPQPSQQQHQLQQLPPKSATSLLAGNAVTNKGLVTASLGLRSLLGSARASSIFLDNDSLILPSEHDGDDDGYHEEYDDDRISESCDSSLNLSLITAGGGGGGYGGMSSAASIGGGSVLTVANTVTSDPTMTMTAAMMVAAELQQHGGAGRGDVNMNMTTPSQVTAAATAAPKSSGVRSWMTKTATITRSINNNNKNYITSPPSSSSTSYYANDNKVPMTTMDSLSQAATPAASGSRPPPPNNATPATTAAASSPAPTTPAAGAANAAAGNADHDLKIVATASMITLDSTSPSAISTNSNTMIGKNGTKTTAATTTTAGLLLAPPSPLAEDDSCIHRDQQEEDGLPTIYNSSKKKNNNNRPMSTFCQYGPRWLKFLLIISIVFLLASVALVAVGVSMQYVDLAVANSNSPDGATSSAVVSTPVGGVDVVQSSEDRNGGPAEPFIPETTGDDNNNNANAAANNDETFDLSNAIATEENKEEEDILASSPSASPLEEDGASTNESNSTANTTETTMAPNQTDSPSIQPSAMPSSIPSLFPTIAPSDSPSTSPTNFPSTLFPTPLPTATMQPSSLQPALAAPELHLPTISDMPSIVPTTTNEEQFFDIVTFYVLAGQWDENQSEMTLRGEGWLLENLPIQQDNNRSAATSAFMVHLGDWNGPVGVQADREYQLAVSRAGAEDDDDEVLPPPTLDCSEQEFIQTHIDFSTCSVPVYFTLGSREFGNCPDPQGALSSYRTWLQDYDLRYWDYPQWEVWNDGSSGYQENWIFNYNDIVFAAINMARGDISRDTTSSLIMDDTEWANRYEATLDWVNMNYYDFRRNNRVFCIFASSGPEDETNREFYEELLSRIEFQWIRMHFVIVHRNLPIVGRNVPRDEEFEDAYSRRYNGIRNLDVISVQASVWPPMKVDIDLSNIIRAEISVDQSTWFNEYVEAESL